jgi:hypothetical protein
MADVRDGPYTAEQILELWVQEHKLKRREVRRKGKRNLRVTATLNNAIRKATIVLRGIRGMQYEGFVG